MLFRLTILVAVLMSGDARAACTFAEQAEKSGKPGIAMMQYIYCAEEENDPEAQYKLGAMFYRGEGLKKPDYRRAVAFFSRAANNGYAPAQVKLGLLYWRGEGVAKNMKMAHKWLYLAQEPKETRWFYMVGPSFDKTAASMYSKINSVMKSSKGEATDADLPAPVAGVLDDVIPSYKEVAEFQHEQLIEAGEEFLTPRGQADLQKYLNALLPEVSPRFPSDMSYAEKQNAMRIIKDWLSPVLLTPNNLNTAKVPILNSLKRAIETP